MHSKKEQLIRKKQIWNANKRQWETLPKNGEIYISIPIYKKFINVIKLIPKENSLEIKKIENSFDKINDLQCILCGKKFISEEFLNKHYREECAKKSKNSYKKGGWISDKSHNKKRKIEIKFGYKDKNIFNFTSPNIFIFNFNYRSFLKTLYWKKCRNLVLKRDNYTCQKCGNKKNLQIHHSSYKYHHESHNPKLCKEYKHLECLITLCKDCHKKIHLQK